VGAKLKAGKVRPPARWPLTTVVLCHQTLPLTPSVAAYVARGRNAQFRSTPRKTSGIFTTFACVIE
jgi:hypothetical protein